MLKKYIAMDVIQVRGEILKPYAVAEIDDSIGEKLVEQAILKHYSEDVLNKLRAAGPPPLTGVDRTQRKMVGRRTMADYYL